MRNDKGFDAEAYCNALTQVVQAQKVPWSQVSRETGVTVSTLTRMARGLRRPDAASLAQLSAWAGLNPADFVQIPPRKVMDEPANNGNRNSLVAIARLLRTDPNLPAETAAALERIIHIAYDELKRTRHNKGPVNSL